MNKKTIIGIVIIVLGLVLLLAGCEKSPQQKAKELEKEVDAELKEKGINYDYEQYFAEVEKVNDGLGSVLVAIDTDAKESYNSALEETEDEDFRNFDLNLASDAVTLETENLFVDIEAFENNEAGYEVPKEYEKFHEEYIEYMKYYNSKFEEFGLSLLPENDFVNAKDNLTNTMNEFENDERTERIVKQYEELENKARKNK